MNMNNPEPYKVGLANQIAYSVYLSDIEKNVDENTAYAAAYDAALNFLKRNSNSDADVLAKEAADAAKVQSGGRRRKSRKSRKGRKSRKSRKGRKTRRR
jgi:hypothetical protein